MYRVMIIDDEKMLRNLLKITIKWDALGFQVVGEAASGIEAINIMDEIKPDIVFVDIRMPFMDGIEFSRFAIRQYPRLKIVILTAHDDFEYARQCVGIGVCEYLLKPIDRVAINEILIKLKKQLDEESPEDTEIEIDIEENSVIRKIKKYLINHYADPELNLTSVAMKFGFNASYLSRIFKERTGTSFVDFLNGCRMERAISLAKEDKYMYQIAKKVGIPDPNYFGKCFKKYTGKTYSDFIKK
ncbi:MAG: response regulator [Epulopiscium sp.]|nr:response regulator [Candidatus Epulonipiscium sp.]